MKVTSADDRRTGEDHDPRILEPARRGCPPPARTGATTMPTASSPMPVPSIGSRAGLNPGSLMAMNDTQAASRPTGTLIRKIQCQLATSISLPPIVGPSSGPVTAPSAEQRAGHAVLLVRVAGEEDALRGGDDGAAADALQDAEHHQRGQVPGQPAQRAGGGEHQHRAGEVVPEAEAPLQPPRHRDDDHVGHHVAGGHPGDPVQRRAEAGADVAQRDVDDGDVDAPPSAPRASRRW